MNPNQANPFIYYEENKKIYLENKLIQIFIIFPYKTPIILLIV